MIDPPREDLLTIFTRDQAEISPRIFPPLGGFLSSRCRLSQRIKDSFREWNQGRKTLDNWRETRLAGREDFYSLKRSVSGTEILVLTRAWMFDHRWSDNRTRVSVWTILWNWVADRRQIRGSERGRRCNVVAKSWSFRSGVKRLLDVRSKRLGLINSAWILSDRAAVEDCEALSRKTREPRGPTWTSGWPRQLGRPNLDATIVSTWKRDSKLLANSRRLSSAKIQPRGANRSLGKVRPKRSALQRITNSSICWNSFEVGSTGP